MHQEKFDKFPDYFFFLLQNAVAVHFHFCLTGFFLIHQCSESSPTQADLVKLPQRATNVYTYFKNPVTNITPFLQFSKAKQVTEEMPYALRVTWHVSHFEMNRGNGR